MYLISLEGHANSFQLGLLSRNLSSMIMPHSTIAKGITFVGRRQIETLFSFSVDLDFDPQWLGERAGNSVYLDEKRHIDFSVAYDNQTSSGKLLQSSHSVATRMPRYRNRSIQLCHQNTETAHQSTWRLRHRIRRISHPRLVFQICVTRKLLT